MSKTSCELQSKCMDIEYYVPFRFPDPNIGLGVLGSPTTVGNPRLFASTYTGFSHGGASMFSRTVGFEFKSKCKELSNRSHVVWVRRGCGSCGWEQTMPCSVPGACFV